MVLYVRFRTFLASNLTTGGILQEISVYVPIFSEIDGFPKIWKGISTPRQKMTDLEPGPETEIFGSGVQNSRNSTKFKK